ncbi:MAG: hypothetical protein HY057_06535 [Rhodospirillales bacterium]|nr:hypothetical protein [Rhodospirillales bacterium]
MNRPTNYIDRSSTLMKEAAQEISGLAAQASEYVDDASANIRTRLAGLTDAF